MLIYRVQDKNGRGPFQRGLTERWARKTAREMDTLKPSIEEFRRLFSRADLIPYLGTGCLTHKQLKGWFKESEMEILQSMGFQAVEIIAEKVLAQSEIQCVFWTPVPLNSAAYPFELYGKSTTQLQETYGI